MAAKPEIVEIQSPGTVLKCRECKNRSHNTPITLKERTSTSPPIVPLPQELQSMGLVEAFYVENVRYEEQKTDVHLNQMKKLKGKTLDLYCTQCDSLVGYFRTDTHSGYGNIGNFYRDHFLKPEKLA